MADCVSPVPSLPTSTRMRRWGREARGAASEWTVVWRRWIMQWRWEREASSAHMTHVLAPCWTGPNCQSVVRAHLFTWRNSFHSAFSHRNVQPEAKNRLDNDWKERSTSATEKIHILLYRDLFTSLIKIIHIVAGRNCSCEQYLFQCLKRELLFSMKWNRLILKDANN